MFIQEVIEPTIKKTMSIGTSIKIPLVDLWYYGSVYEKPDNLPISNLVYNHYLSLNLTNEINKILVDNGYKVTKEINTYSSEHQNGRGKFIISWDE